MNAIRRGFDEVLEVTRDTIESTIDEEVDELPAGMVTLGC